MKRCHLCREKRKLCQSHIFSEFLYNSIYDEKHRFEVVSLESKSLSPFHQKGVRAELLCVECEERLNKYETYASKVLFQPVHDEIEVKGRYSLVSGIDYSKFKLFLLSLLWRASVTVEKPFAKFSLGEHEENLRMMLLSNDPGSFADYPSTFRIFLKHAELMRALIIPPVIYPVDSDVLARSTFAGLICTTMIAKPVKHDRITEEVLREDGILPIKRMTPAEEQQLIDKLEKGIPAEDWL